MKIKSPKIAFIIRQAGTANAFIPLILSLQKRGWSTIILAYENGHKILTEKGVVHQQVTSFQQGLSFLNDVDIVLTGTSLFVEDDAQYWKWAAQTKITAIAFVDSWVSYWERFTIQDRFDCQPNFIAVVDELMQQKMIEAGAPVEKLVISGSPAFDALLSKRTSRTVNNVYRELLIITDPLIDLYGKDTLAKIGYTELEVMDFIFQNLSIILGDNQKDYNLKIKIHPREHFKKYQPYQMKYGTNFRTFQLISKTASNINLILNSDLILGMNSILLLEAAILGKQVVSIQPNRKQDNDITDGKQGIKVFVDLNMASNFLKMALSQNRNIPFTPMAIVPSTPKFTQLIEAHL